MPTESLKIYIAAPYTALTLQEMEDNVAVVIDASLKIYAKGHFPYIPHLTHFIDVRAKELGVNMTWDDYIRWDLVWLELCDAFLYLKGSRGADLELAEATKTGKRIFRSIDEIPLIEFNRPTYQPITSNT